MATQIRLAQLTGSIGSGTGQINDGTSAAAGSAIAAGDLSTVLSHLASSIKRIHGASSFSQQAAGTFSAAVVPAADGTLDLGDEDAEWAALRANAVYSQVALNVSSSAGAITIDGQTGVNLQENGTSILAISDSRAVSFANLTTFAATPSSTFDVDAAGDMTLDASTFAVGGDGDTGAITMDSTAGISLDAAGASNLSTSSGALLLDASGTSSGAGNVEINSAGGEIKIGDDTASGKITIGGETSSRAEVELNAARLDLNAGSNGVQMDASGAIEVTSSGGGVSIDGAGASNLSTSSGALLLDASGTSSGAGNIEVNSAGGEIKIGDDAVAQKITVGGETSTRTEVEMNAILLDLNAGSGGLLMNAGAASELVTSAGDLTVKSSAARVIMSGSSGADSVLIQSDATVSGDFVISGNLTVSGDTVQQDVSKLTVEDPLIELARNQGTSADALDIGFFGRYGESGTAKFAGLFRDTDDSLFHLFKDTQEDLSSATVVNKSATGYAKAGLVVDSLDADGGVTIDNITIDGQEIDVSSGNLTLDVAGNIALNADGGSVTMEDASATLFTFAANEIDVASGDLLLDVAGNIKLNADGGSVTMEDASSTLFTFAANEIDVASGDLLLDVAGDISLDADGDNITMKAGSDDTDGLDFNYSSDTWTIASKKESSAILLAARGTGSNPVEALRVAGDGSSSAYARMASGIQLQFGGAGDSIAGTGSALSVISGGDILLDPAGGEVNVDGNIISQTDGTDTLGRLAASHTAGSSASGLTSNLSSGQSFAMSATQNQAVLYGSSLSAGSGSSISGVSVSELTTSSLSSFGSSPSGTLSFSGTGGASVSAGTIIALGDSGGNKAFFVVVEDYSGSSSSSTMKVHFMGNISGSTTSVSSISTLQQHSSITGSSALSGVSASADQAVRFTDGSGNTAVFKLVSAISSGTPWGFVADPRDDLSSGITTFSSSTSFASATAGGSIDEQLAWLGVAADQLVLPQNSEPTVTSDKLYNVSGTLHWNGAPIGVPVVYRHVMTSSNISSSSSAYTMVGADRTGDSDVTFSSSTDLNKIQVYLNGQLQFVASSGGDVALTSTSLQLDFGSSGSLVADDILQVIVYA